MEKGHINGELSKNLENKHKKYTQQTQHFSAKVEQCVLGTIDKAYLLFYKRRAQTIVESLQK